MAHPRAPEPSWIKSATTPSTLVLFVLTAVAFNQYGPKRFEPYLALLFACANIPMHYRLMELRQDLGGVDRVPRTLEGIPYIGPFLRRFYENPALGDDPDEFKPG